MENQKGRRVKKDIFGVFEKHFEKYEQGWIIYNECISRFTNLQIV